MKIKVNLMIKVLRLKITVLLKGLQSAQNIQGVYDIAKIKFNAVGNT